MDFAHSQLGKPYNTPTVFGYLLDHNWTNPTAWDCSQFITACLMKGGLKVLNVLIGCTHKITPETLHLSPIFIGCKLEGNPYPVSSMRHTEKTKFISSKTLPVIFQRLTKF